MIIPNRAMYEFILFDLVKIQYEIHQRDGMAIRSGAGFLFD